MTLDRARLLRVVGVLAACAALLIVTTQFIARPWVVAGSSMTPALEPGDRVLLDLWSYRSRPPRVGEIVVFRAPGGESGQWVKRVSQPPLVSTPPRPFLWPPGKSLPSGWLWVEGDRAVASLDSREVGPIPPEQIVGRVAWRYWPLSRLGPIPTPPRSNPKPAVQPDAPKPTPPTTN